MTLTLALVIGIMTLAILGQSTFGFGAGLISIPVLSLLLGVRDGVSLALMLQVTTGLLVLKVFRSLHWKAIVPLLFAVLPATIAGIYVLRYVNETVLRVFLAVFIVLFLLKSLFWPTVKLPHIEHPAWAVLSGSLSGFLQGTIGCGGPPLVIYLDQVAEKATFRATILTILFISNLLRLGISAPIGLLNARVLTLFLYCLPFLIVGMLLGDRLHHVIGENFYKRSIQLILLVSVISLFW